MYLARVWRGDGVQSVVVGQGWDWVGVVGCVGLGRGLWVEEWEGVFDVDRVGWDDCALVVGDGIETVVYGWGGWEGGVEDGGDVVLN